MTSITITTDQLRAGQADWSDFIAAMHNTFPAMAKEIESLRARVKELEGK